MQSCKSLTLCRTYFTVQDNYRKFPINHSAHAIKRQLLSTKGSLSWKYITMKVMMEVHRLR